jgi:hypothetical protein
MSNQNSQLIRCVVNSQSRTFNLYSSSGEERTVSCDSMDEFLNVLKFVREVLDENVLAYSSPL